MDQATFVKHLRAAATAALDHTHGYILETLSDAMRFRVHLPPEGGRDQGMPKPIWCTEEEAVAALWRAGAVPAHVDISVVNQAGAETVVELFCCSPFTSNEKDLFRQVLGDLYTQQYGKEDYPPFKVQGPSLPARYKRGDRFSIWQHTQCWSQEELEQSKPHIEKIWSLDLRGGEFDDVTLSSLPEFPSLEGLELHCSPVQGVGLTAQSKHPKLRVMTVHLAQPEGFHLKNILPFPALTNLSIDNLPPRPCGLEELLGSLPSLEWLNLESTGSIFLDVPVLRVSRQLTLTGASLRGEARVPSKLEILSLHLREATVPDLRRLLQNLEHVGALFLKGTPVDEPLAQELVSRLGPELTLIDLAETKVTLDGRRRLSELDPGLRVGPGWPLPEKQREILAWKGKVITLTVMDTKWIPIVIRAFVGVGSSAVVVQDCSEFSVTIKDGGSGARVVALMNIEIAFDNANNRLELRESYRRAPTYSAAISTSGSCANTARRP